MKEEGEEFREVAELRGGGCVVVKARALSANARTRNGKVVNRVVESQGGNRKGKGKIVGSPTWNKDNCDVVRKTGDERVERKGG